MNYSETVRDEVMRKVPFQVKECLKDTLEKIEKESLRNGEFASMEDFIQRMLNAHLDIHAFTVLAEHMPMEFPGGGTAKMLRPVLALMGYDPDYATSPEVKVYPLSHWDAWGDLEDLPFN